MSILHARFGNNISAFLADARAKQKRWIRLLNDRPTGIRIKIRTKNPEFDLKSRYWSVIRVSSLISAVFLACCFFFYPEYYPTVRMESGPAVVMQVQNIPETRQTKRPPPPPRPAVPLAVEGDEVPEDVTIETTELDFDRVEFSLGPVGEIGPLSDEPMDYMEIDFKPHPIRIVAPEYPQTARRSKLEGKVTIRVLVNKEGEVEQAEVLNGPEIFRAAALAAARQFRFRPGKHEGERRKVWMVMPINFTLK